MRQVFAGFVAVCFSLTLSAPAAAQNVVTHWNEQVEDVLAAGRPAGSAEVLLGMVSIAVYDSVVAIEGGYAPFGGSPLVSRPASVDAAAATAAYRVARARVTAAQQAVLDARYSGFIETLPGDAATRNGVAVGEQVAAALLQARSGDGFDNTVPYVPPPPGPGVWEPTALTPPIDVKLQQVRPLSFESPSAFRPDGPNLLTTEEYAADFNEVKRLGRTNSGARSAEQTDIARFWSENPLVHWNRNLRALAIDRGLGVTESARLFAMIHTATADAIIACFEAKYFFLSWRPVHAIRRADTDGNPGTSADSTWDSLLNVNHPEYPSGHGCWTGAVTETLAAFFGTDRLAFSMDTKAGGVTQINRYYRGFHDVLKEVVDARVYAGLHFRNTMMEGARLGRQVARHVTGNYFLAVR